MNQHHATASGTKNYFARFPKTQLARAWGRTGLHVSRIGFGTYRTHSDNPTHLESLILALKSGVNLIDTSTNYMDGHAEHLIGRALRTLFSDPSQEWQRNQFVVVGKGGYVQGQNLVTARTRKQNGMPWPETVEYHPDCWHNISAEYLESQISSSLERLGLETLDVFLLHNPEYFLKTSNNIETYYERIRKAFQYLETEVDKGRIQYYGISSNGFPVPETTAEFTSLARVLELAKEIKKDHHFAVAQFPFNLLEAGAALNHNNNELTLLEFAKKNKIATLINRPFNAFARNRMTRLTSFPKHDEVEVKGLIHQVLGKVIELEKKYGGGKLPKGLMWGHALRESYQQIDDVLQWREALQQQILPSLTTSLARLDAAHEAWASQYRESALQLLDLMTKNLESLAQSRSQLLIDQIDAAASELKETELLTQKMIRLYESLPGVDVVLAGIRQPHYVQDVLNLHEPIRSEIAFQVLNQFKRHA